MKKSKKQLYWVLQFLGWSLFSIVNLAGKFFFGEKLTRSDITLTIFVTLLGIAFSHIIRWVYKHFKWHKQDLRLIIHKVAITAVITAIINLFVLYFFVSMCPQTVHKSFNLIGVYQIIIRFSIVYFAWGVLYFTVYFFTNFKKAEIINLQNKAQMTEIHLNKLKSQLNPHFMFNAMNVIRALIDEDKDKAKEGITQLSNILRQTLNVNQKKLISIEEELEIVNDYLSLEKLRFEERLNWKSNIPEECAHYQIPPMLLQTVVENGIKHGISNEISGGTITIDGSCENEVLKVCVTNPGQYNPNNTEETFGLKNSEDRLAFIFEGKAKIKISNKNSEEVQTCIYLPKEI